MEKFCAEEFTVTVARLRRFRSFFNVRAHNIRLRKILVGSLLSTLVVFIGPAVDVLTAPSANAAGSGIRFVWAHNIGTGLAARTNITTSTTGYCRAETIGLDNSWGSGSPTGCNVDNFAGYGSGFISALSGSTKTYQFCVESDDRIVIDVGGANVIDDWQDQGPASCTTGAGNAPQNKTFQFVGSTTYAINVWFYENGGGATLRLFWRENSTGSYSLVPIGNLATQATLLGPAISQSIALPNYDFGNTGYTYSFVASGGTTPYTYSLASGTLPSILRLDTANGSILYNSSGTNNTGQTATDLRIRVTDTNGMTALSNTFSVTLVKGNQPTPVTVSTLSGTYPSATLTGSGGNGTGAYSFTRLTTGTAGCSISGSTITATSAGTCTFTATRATDTNYNASTSSTLTFTFSARPGIVVKANPISVGFGQTISPTAVLSNFGGSDSATATSVTYRFAGIGTTSYASSTTAPTAVGTYSVSPTAATLSFSTGSSAGYLSSTFVSDTLTILATVPGAVTAVASASTSPTTAIVSFTAPSNTGGVSISSYALSNGTDALTATNTTSPITITGLSPGGTYVFRVNAINSVGRSETASATSMRMPLLVTTSPSTTTGIFGVPITSIIPTVTGGSGISYSISPSLPAGLTLNSNGTISGTPTETSTAKTYTQTATVTGTSGTSTFTLSVVRANSAVSIPTISPALPTAGSALTLTATVTSNTAATLTGTISFRNSAGTALCTTATISLGIGSCSFTPTTAETVTVSSHYSGMTFVETSTSTSSLTFTPSKANPVVTLSGPSNGLINSALTLTVAISGISGTNRSGSVQFSVGGSAISGCTSATVSTNAATCSFTPTTAGLLTLTATYLGDINYNSAVSSSINLVISTCTQSTTGLTLATGVPASGYCAVQITAGTSGSLGLPVGVISMNSRVLIIGGGGSGGSRHGGGGGAGSLLFADSYTVSDTTTVTIGAGGAATSITPTVALNNGKSTVFGSITAAGGGAGGGINSGSGFSGGSGGGGAGSFTGSNGSQTSHIGFSSNVNKGGQGTGGGSQANYSGGGGGGAGSSGFNGTGSGTKPGKGGDGLALTMTLIGSNSCFAAGGGGGSYKANPGGVGGGCFIGSETITVGGVGNRYAQVAGAGAANTGSGGGGGGFEGGTNYASGAGGSGLVALRYISPATIIVPVDTSTASRETVILVATAQTFANLFTRTYQWQKRINSTWTNETSTSASTLLFTFVAQFGGVSVQQFRLLVTDSDGVLSTTTASRTISITVTPLAQPTLNVASTYAFAGSPFTLFTEGGAGAGAVSFSSVATGSAAGCSISGAVLSLSTTGICRVVATKSADLDYLVKISETTTVSFVTFQIAVQEVPANPVTGVQTLGSTVIAKGPDICTTGCVPEIRLIAPFSAFVGDIIVLTGINFTGTTKVVFNVFTDAINFTVDSDIQITVQVPAGLSPGECGIEVVAPGGVSFRNLDFEVL